MSEFPTIPVPNGAPPPPQPSAEEALLEALPADAPTDGSGWSPESAAAPTPAPAAAPLIDVRAGKVTRVTAEEVHLDLGDGQQGSVPVIEFAGQPLPQIGDEVSVIVVRSAGENGQMQISKRQADELSFWQTVKPGDLLEGVVTGMNKGGLDIDIGGARAFLPSSQVDVRRIKDISTLIGEHVRCMVTQVDPTTRDLVVSRRKVIDKERKDKRAEALQRLEPGQVIKGRVSSITDFGAFVNVGDVEGLVHITDMSWGRLKHPSEAVQVGQEVEVSILKVDRGTGKVSLGMKQIKPDPWDGVEARYASDARVKGRVLRFADFGAFIELEEGLEALLPISEMSWTGRITHPSELLKLGDEVELVVLKVEARRRRISLGLRQTTENPWDTLERQFPVQSTAKGKVSKIMEFGAFVELLPGIDGLVHISELSDRRVKAVGDVVQEGQEVEVRILKIDRAAQRISLSMKPPPKLAPPPTESEKARLKKQRKRPLRGGLASHFDW